MNATMMFEKVMACVACMEAKCASLETAAELLKEAV